MTNVITDKTVWTRQSEMADLARRATRCCRYYIPLHFDTNPESLRPFVPEIWPNNVFNLSAIYDLDLWPKILKIFVSHGVPIRNMYAKFHNDRLGNGWDITLWNFAKTRTNKHTNTQTDMGITIPRPPPMGGEVKIWLLINRTKIDTVYASEYHKWYGLLNIYLR